MARHEPCVRLPNTGQHSQQDSRYHVLSPLIPTPLANHSITSPWVLWGLPPNLFRAACPSFISRGRYRRLPHMVRMPRGWGGPASVQAASSAWPSSKVLFFGPLKPLRRHSDGNTGTSTPLVNTYVQPDRTVIKPHPRYFSSPTNVHKRVQAGAGGGESSPDFAYPRPRYCRG